MSRRKITTHSKLQACYDTDKYVRFGPRDYFRINSQMQNLAFLQEKPTHVHLAKMHTKKNYCLVPLNCFRWITHWNRVSAISSFAKLVERRFERLILYVYSNRKKEKKGKMEPQITIILVLLCSKTKFK